MPLDDPVSFDAPPVGEVVLGLQFAGPVSDDAIALADFWPKIREDFPAMRRLAAMQRINERFGPAAGVGQFELNFGGEPQRYWFTSADGRWLVQVQPDRFVLNWRKVDEGDIYPRYKSVRARFEKLYRTFTAAVGEERLVANPPEWCATTYINNILAGGPNDPNVRLPLSRIIRLVSSPKSSVLPPVEDTALQQKYLLDPLADGQEPRGRLFINVSPAIRAQDQMPGYSLELKVLSRPEAHSRAAVMRCFDQGRGLIVRSFKDITTPAMHTAWGLQENDE